MGHPMFSKTIKKRGRAGTGRNCRDGSNPFLRRNCHIFLTSVTLLLQLWCYCRKLFLGTLFWEPFLWDRPCHAAAAVESTRKKPVLIGLLVGDQPCRQKKQRELVYEIRVEGKDLMYNYFHSHLRAPIEF